MGQMPGLQHELFLALYEFLILFAAADHAAATNMFHRLQRGVLEDRAGLVEALEDVPRLAQRLWTSDETIKIGVSGEERAFELCELLNSVLREDNPQLLSAGLPLIRAIDSLCVLRGALPESRLPWWPVDSCCYRGGGLPDEHCCFFKSGIKYRVPGFLATSFQRSVREVSLQFSSIP